MTILNRHIYHLLSTGQRVTLPGVGTFMPVMRSSSLCGDLLTPPRLTVSFDSSYTVGDNILEKSVAQREDCSQEHARRVIEEAASEAARRLSVGRELAIDGVGTLSRHNIGAALSVSDSFACSDWLSPLELTPLEVRKVAQADIARASEALSERRNSLMRSLSRTASSAAAIAVLALITFIWTQLPGRSQHAAQTASLGIEKIASEPAEPLITTPGATEPTLVLVLNTPADGVAPARRRAEKPVAAPERYIIVVASLASEKEAQMYIRSHSQQGIDLRALQSDGRWRVYALTAPTFEEITSQASKTDIYALFPSAWVCRR